VPLEERDHLGRDARPQPPVQEDDLGHCAPRAQVVEDRPLLGLRLHGPGIGVEELVEERLRAEHAEAAVAVERRLARPHVADHPADALERAPVSPVEAGSQARERPQADERHREGQRPMRGCGAERQARGGADEEGRGVNREERQEKEEVVARDRGQDGE